MRATFSGVLVSRLVPSPILLNGMSPSSISEEIAMPMAASGALDQPAPEEAEGRKGDAARRRPARDHRDLGQ